MQAGNTLEFQAIELRTLDSLRGCCCARTIRNTFEALEALQKLDAEIKCLYQRRYKPAAVPISRAA